MFKKYLKQGVMLTGSVPGWQLLGYECALRLRGKQLDSVCQMQLEKFSKATRTASIYRR